MFGADMSIFARKRARAIGKLARLHPREQIEVLLDGAIAKRALLPDATILVRFFRRHVANVGFPGANELYGVGVDRFEIIGGVKRLDGDCGLRIANCGKLEVVFPIS